MKQLQVAQLEQRLALGMGALKQPFPLSTYSVTGASKLLQPQQPFELFAQTIALSES